MARINLPDLLELERRGWDALCASTGGEHYGRLMTADGVMVLVNGMVLDRDGVAASFDGAPPWSSYDLSEPRLVELGEDSAGLVYRATATRDSDPTPFEALMTSVYRLVDGQWRLALYQQTAVPS